MKSNLETIVINSISRLMCVKNSEPQIIVYQVMMLPDCQYNFLFSTLTSELNIKVSTIYEIFTQITNKCLTINPKCCFHKAQQQSGKINVADSQKCNIPTLSQFKLEFSQTLRKFIRNYAQTNCNTDKELCKYLSVYFSVHNENQFWERVHYDIPYKTSQQLKQYFQKSFSKCQFENINNCCKLKIMEMTRTIKGRSLSILRSSDIITFEPKQKDVQNIPTNFGVILYFYQHIF
ncbi:Hypothetical_protein [Hexamita inflata]|uniref:Hypothetical_protein n=1 Tax=Hexamita inflata TaxID=28002 RepID=A0AA86QZ89_9EUKA|nr:Hypothetical protein HINF_LOCUS50064 [Hexamita inflata]